MKYNNTQSEKNNTNCPSCLHLILNQETVYVRLCMILNWWNLKVVALSLIKRCYPILTFIIIIRFVH